EHTRDCAQLRRRLDNALDRLKHTTLRLLQIVGDCIAFGILATKDQTHGQREECSKTRLAGFLRRAEHLFGIDQATIGIGPERMVEEYRLRPAIAGMACRSPDLSAYRR